MPCRHPKVGQPFTPCTHVHRDRLARTDGDRQHTEELDLDPANTTNIGWL